MSDADDRRRRQASSIGFVPAPAGQSRKAMQADDDLLLERSLQIEVRGHHTGRPTIRAVITPSGIDVIDLGGEA